jgi:hypothetical protein
MVKNPLYKHAIAAYGAAMADIPSQIWYGSCPKARDLVTLLSKSGYSGGWRYNSAA